MLQFSIKNITPLALFWALLFMGWGCRKDVLELREYPNTHTELSQFLMQVPDPATATTFQFNGLNEDKILSTPQGLRVFLTDVDQLFATKNTTSPVLCSTCAELKIVVTIARAKGDILARELATNSVDDALLESAGMVQVQAFCGATELQLLPGRTIKVQLPAIDPVNDMFIHTGVFDNNGFRGWKNTSQEVFKADWPGPTGGSVQGYELIVAQLGWSNCARPLSHATATPFCVTLKPSYTGLNTRIYLVFENSTVIAPLKFDDATHSFCFPAIPAGYPVQVVSVAKLEQEFWLGATMTETGTNSMLPVTPQKQDAVQILGYLRGL